MNNWISSNQKHTHARVYYYYKGAKFESKEEKRKPKIFTIFLLVENWKICISFKYQDKL